jgi:hypothetical protein
MPREKYQVKHKTPMIMINWRMSPISDREALATRKRAATQVQAMRKR